MRARAPKASIIQSRKSLIRANCAIIYIEMDAQENGIFTTFLKRFQINRN